LIDDTKKNRRPVQTISFHDLESVGFEIFVQEFTKEKPDGSLQTAVKVVKVLKGGVDFDKEDMKELLYIMGIDTHGSNFWVTPKKKHRALSQSTPVYNYRYMGYERVDKEYIKSGRASHEAIMYASSMRDMQEHAEKLQNGGDDE